mgnify:CR=1 FL=1
MLVGADDLDVRLDQGLVEGRGDLADAAARAVERTFGRKPLPYYSGGSIPIISTFEKELGVKSVLLGFGLDRDAIHSPNESYGLENFLRGIETIVWFYREFAAGR